MLVGKFPHVDHTGEKFHPNSWRGKMAGQDLNLRALCIRKFGDWAWYTQVLGLRGWRGETADLKCCWTCGAGFNALINCYDFSQHAEWRQTLVTQAEFYRELVTTNMFVSKIWTIPGFRLSFVRPDWMHVVDLGIAPTCVGSVLWYCFKALGGSFQNSKKATSKIFNMLKVAAAVLGHNLPIQALTIGMIRPAMKKKCLARLKAAECRYLVPIVLQMFEMNYAANGEHESKFFHCLEALNDCYLELYRWVEIHSCCRLAARGRRHVMLFAELCKESTDPGYWSLQPKHHIFIHLVELSKTSPRIEWNYMDEDAIGHGARRARLQNIPNFNTGWIRRQRLLYTFDPEIGRRHRS